MCAPRTCGSQVPRSRQAAGQEIGEGAVEVQQAALRVRQPRLQCGEQPGGAGLRRGASRVGGLITWGEPCCARRNSPNLDTPHLGCVLHCHPLFTHSHVHTLSESVTHTPASNLTLDASSIINSIHTHTYTNTHPSLEPHLGRVLHHPLQLLGRPRNALLVRGQRIHAP